MNEQVIIDPEFRDLLPPLTDEEYSRLESLCKKQGILDSLKVWNGFLIDGHNRLSISQTWDLNYEVRDMTDDFPNKAAVMQWIIDNQGARRNLTKEQLVKAWSKWEKERAKEAEEKMLSGKKDPTSNLKQGERNPTTAAEVAKKIGVSENTYRDMKLITDEGTPEQIERMNKGGKGNGVSRIAGEIRAKKISAQEIKEKKCTKCGRIIPIENFYWKKLRNRYESQCKECQNAQRISAAVNQIKDVKGNVIQNSGEFSAIPEDQIIGNLYDDSSIEVTISDVIQEFMTNFNTALKNLETILKNNNGVISEHKNEISEMLSQASDKFQTLRREYEQ